MLALQHVILHQNRLGPFRCTLIRSMYQYNAI
jgi:hypothetical protein